MGFFSSLAAGALDSAANIGLSIYGMNRQSHENRMNYNRQVDMWNMNNAYNTPKEQMKRFKEAGLNPNLIYGQTNTAQMPNNDAGYVSPNFDKLNMFSDALDGYQNQKDAEATLKRLEEQKAYDRKRQEIIDNRQAKAFEMEMKLKQAQIDNIKAKPFLEAQKNQLKEQKIYDKNHEKVVNSVLSPSTLYQVGRFGYSSYNLLKNGVLPTMYGSNFLGALGPAIALERLVRKGINYLQDRKTQDNFADWGRKYSPFATQYEENIWR